MACRELHRSKLCSARTSKPYRQIFDHDFFLRIQYSDTLYFVSSDNIRIHIHRCGNVWVSTSHAGCISLQKRLSAYRAKWTHMTEWSSSRFCTSIIPNWTPGRYACDCHDNTCHGGRMRFVFRHSPSIVVSFPAASTSPDLLRPFASSPKLARTYNLLHTYQGLRRIRL